MDGLSNVIRYLSGAEFERRVAPRAVVHTGSSIGLLEHLTSELPGGEREQGETTLGALYREVREETGSIAVDVRPLGATVEYYAEKQRVQFSPGFLVHALSVLEQRLTPQERGAGGDVHWVSYTEAWQEVRRQDVSDDDTGRIIKGRDTYFLSRVGSPERAYRFRGG